MTRGAKLIYLFFVFSWLLFTSFSGFFRLRRFPVIAFTKKKFLHRILITNFAQRNRIQFSSILCTIEISNMHKLKVDFVYSNADGNVEFFSFLLRTFQPNRRVHLKSIWDKAATEWVVRVELTAAFDILYQWTYSPIDT